jgi:hypothetical protein
MVGLYSGHPVQIDASVTKLGDPSQARGKASGRPGGPAPAGARRGGGQPAAGPRGGNCLRVIELGSAFRTAPFGCGTPPLVVLSLDGTWMMVDGVAVDVATLTRHAALVPAGTHEPDPIMFPLGPKQLLVKVYDSNYHTIAAAACDLPAGRCQKVSVPFFGPIW